jgi:hypothetical protein
MSEAAIKTTIFFVVLFAPLLYFVPELVIAILITFTWGAVACLAAHYIGNYIVKRSE